MRTASDTPSKLGDRRISRIVYERQEIARRVSEMGREITEAHEADEELLVLGLLKGSFIFVADLVRAIDRPLHVDFLVAQSYGSHTVSSGEVRLLYHPETGLKGRSVIVVEDIVDSGTTMDRVIPMLEDREPAALEICALLHKKKTTLRKEVRWVGFDAPDEFLVGYGLDYSEDFRHLPYIASL